MRERACIRGRRVYVHVMDPLATAPLTPTADIEAALSEDLERDLATFSKLSIRPGLARVTVRSLPFHPSSRRACMAMAERLRAEGEDVCVGMLWPAVPEALRALIRGNRYGAVGMSLSAPITAINAPIEQVIAELIELGPTDPAEARRFGRPNSCVRASSWSSILVERT